MASPPEVPTFEFFDLSGPGARGGSDPPPTRRLAGTVAMAGILLALVLTGLAVSDDADDRDTAANAPASPTNARKSSATTQFTTPSTLESEPAEAEHGLWPDSPADRNPHVIGRPGPNVPILGELSEMAIVYVNSIHRPTVINLDTGKVQQVDVARTRSYDYFGVESGRVVLFDEQSRNSGDATDRAALFHVHPASSTSSFEEFRSSPNPSPHLCLTDQPCPNDAWTFERPTNGTDTIRRANELDDPAVLDMLFGDSWIVDGGNRSAPPDFGVNLRIPTPLNDEVWIVHQPAPNNGEA